MIQRIQSIWLLLASITIACLLFIPMVTATVGTTEYKVLADGLYQSGDGARKLESSLPLLISVIAVSLMAIVNIFNFKNRTTQKRFIMGNIVLIIGLSFWCSVYAKKIPGGLESANYGIGMFLPVIAIIFCVLAMRGINNDEKLLKSADRLR
jgi:membrane protease YdiL (CAAX protease family)